MTLGNLDRLIVSLDVAIEALAICEVKRGLRLVFAPVNAIEVHYVLAGTMYLMVPGAETAICPPGSIALIPPGMSQSIAADAEPDRDVIANDNCSMTRGGLLLHDAAGGGAGDLRVVCGVIMANLSGSFGLLDDMTEPIVEDMNNVEIVRQAFATMLKEVANPGLFTRSLTGALMKTCLALMLRSYFDGDEARPTVLGRLRDPRLCNAVFEVLKGPAAPLSVALLASAAGMSRSAFARKFSDAFSMTPMEFVAKVRLHHAAKMLRSTTVSIKTIAASIGFASRSHFSRAFREAYGTDPRNFRKALPELDNDLGGTLSPDPSRSLRDSQETLQRR